MATAGSSHTRGTTTLRLRARNKRVVGGAEAEKQEEECNCQYHEAGREVETQRRDREIRARTKVRRATQTG